MGPPSYFVTEEAVSAVLARRPPYDNVTKSMVREWFDWFCLTRVDAGQIKLQLLDVERLNVNKWLNSDTGNIEVYGDRLLLRQRPGELGIDWIERRGNVRLLSDSQQKELDGLPAACTHGSHVEEVLSRLDAIAEPYLE